jgi:hypothetical protein
MVREVSRRHSISQQTLVPLKDEVRRSLALDEWALRPARPLSPSRMLRQLREARDYLLCYSPPPLSTRTRAAGYPQGKEPHSSMITQLRCSRRLRPRLLSTPPAAGDGWLDGAASEQTPGSCRMTLQIPLPDWPKPPVSTCTATRPSSRPRAWYRGHGSALLFSLPTRAVREDSAMSGQETSFPEIRLRSGPRGLVYRVGSSEGSLLALTASRCSRRCRSDNLQLRVQCACSGKCDAWQAGA